MLPVGPPEILSMHTRDGVRLDADVWRPDAPGPHPVLLMRQPYGRRIASTLVFAHPAWYAAQGYIVVIQDVRGTGTSDGSFRLFFHEEADGADAVRWAAALPGSSGRIGMYGFSYQAVTQWLALAGGADLHAMAPAMAGWDIRSDWAWEGGAFAFASGLGWAAQMGAVKARHDGLFAESSELEAIARNPPLATRERAAPVAMAHHAALTHYADWLANAEPGPYWEAFAPRARLAGRRFDVPALHVGGWYDQMLMGTLDGFAAIEAANSAEQRLVVGPWTHQPWGRRVGAVDFGDAAVSPIDRLQVAFFDKHLKGVSGEDTAPIRLFDLGTHNWTDAQRWPEKQPVAWYLGGHGLAAATTTDGTLAAQPGLAGVECWVHDPWRPVPSLGGHNAQPGGMQDRSALDDRADVACFTSAPLGAPLHLRGRVAVDLAIEADTPSFDISAVLCTVDPAGRSWNVTSGHARFEGAVTGTRRIAMRATTMTVPPGHRLRLSLAGAAFPAFPVNPGTGASPATTRADDERVVVVTLRHGDDSGSCLWLPVH